MLKIVENKTLNEVFEVSHYKDKTGKEVKFGDFIDYDITENKTLKFFVDFNRCGIVLIAASDKFKIKENFPNYMRNESNNMSNNNVFDFPSSNYFTINAKQFKTKL